MRPSKHFTIRVLVASAVASIMLPILAIAQAGFAEHGTFRTGIRTGPGQ